MFLKRIFKIGLVVFVFIGKMLRGTSRDRWTRKLLFDRKDLPLHDGKTKRPEQVSEIRGVTNKNIPFY